MIVEKIDPNSGAILFKKDRESQNLETALKDIEELKDRVSRLEIMIKYLLEEKA